MDDHMCVVRFYTHLPLHLYPWNAVLVTSLQARRLPRTAQKRKAAFPPEIQQQMAAALNQLNS
jgi:hypothetical protein